MAVVRALADVALVLGLLRAPDFDFLVLNVVIELLLALQLRLVLRVSRRVVLLAGVIAAHEIRVLLQLNLRDGLKHLMLRLGALAAAGDGAGEVLRARLVSILHNLRDFLANAVGLLDVGRDLHIVGFVILFVRSATYKFSLLLVVAGRRAHRLTYPGRRAPDVALQHFDALLLHFCGFLFDYDFLLAHALHRDLALRVIVCHHRRLVFGFLLVAGRRAGRGHARRALVVLVWRQMLGHEGVRELRNREGCCQKLRNTPRQELLLEDLAHGGALGGVLNQHVGDEVLEVLAVGGRDGGVSSSEDFEHKPFHRVSVESMPEGDHLIEDAPERPDVRLLVVRLLLADFGREVVGRADGGLRAVVGVLEHAGNSEVTDLNLSVLRHENVLGLEVSVQNLAVVDVLDCQRHLHKPVQNLVLRVAHLQD